jgi:hypothetical protein
MPAKKTPVDDYAVLNPIGIEVEVRGRKYTILPLEDFAYQRIFSAIVRTSGLFVSVAETFREASEGVSMVGKLAGFADTFSDSLQELIPDATTIIASALREQSDFITANFRLVDRVRILRAVLEAEDIPTLLGEATSLSNLLAPAKTETDETGKQAQEKSTI